MTEGIKDIMEQPPGEPNFGRKKAQDDDGEWGQFPLDVPGMQARDLLTPLDSQESDPVPYGSGYGVVEASRGQGVVGSYGAADAGMIAHRGVLAPDEYVDTLALREAVLAELGVTYPEFTGTYSNGRPTAEQRQQRAEIDARLLALSRSGTNLSQLAFALGVSEKTLDRALIRARDADVEPMVATGVVRTRHACFKCGEPGKKRKRRFSDSPEPWVTTIALCDEHYRASFETRKGNPGYWAFRSRLAVPAGAR